MALSILVMGESGSGKSTSLRNLIADETFVIQAISKPLPFRHHYKKFTPNNDGTESTGNIHVSSEHHKIINTINHINTYRADIKNVVIDDFQYVMAIEFMNRATEKGYDKFTELAQHTFQILQAIERCRADLTFFILTHSELDQNGRSKIKTVGKMLDDKITLEGLFTVVLHTQVAESQYVFLTQNDGRHIAKSPIDMFDKKYIENDLQLVKSRIDTYYNADIPQ